MSTKDRLAKAVELVKSLTAKDNMEQELGMAISAPRLVNTINNCVRTIKSAQDKMDKAIDTLKKIHPDKVEVVGAFPLEDQANAIFADAGVAVKWVFKSRKRTTK